MQEESPNLENEDIPEYDYLPPCDEIIKNHRLEQLKNSTDQQEIIAFFKKAKICKWKGSSEDLLSLKFFKEKLYMNLNLFDLGLLVKSVSVFGLEIEEMELFEHKEMKEEFWKTWFLEDIFKLLVNLNIQYWKPEFLELQIIFSLGSFQDEIINNNLEKTVEILQHLLYEYEESLLDYYTQEEIVTKLHPCLNFIEQNYVGDFIEFLDDFVFSDKYQIKTTKKYEQINTKVNYHEYIVRFLAAEKLFEKKSIDKEFLTELLTDENLYGLGYKFFVLFNDKQVELKNYNSVLELYDKIELSFFYDFPPDLNVLNTVHALMDYKNPSHLKLLLRTATDYSMHEDAPDISMDDYSLLRRLFYKNEIRDFGDKGILPFLEILSEKYHDFDKLLDDEVIEDTLEELASSNPSSLFKALEIPNLDYFIRNVLTAIEKLHNKASISTLCKVFESNTNVFDADYYCSELHILHILSKFDDEQAWNCIKSALNHEKDYVKTLALKLINGKTNNA